MPTEWREGKEKFEQGYVGDDQLLRGTQERDIFFKGTPVKASRQRTPENMPISSGLIRLQKDGTVNLWFW